MTAQTEIPTDSGRAPRVLPTRTSKTLKVAASKAVDDAKVRIARTSAKAKVIARDAGGRAQDIAGRTATEVRKRPVTTGLILAAAGIALLLLTNRKARQIAMDAAPKVLKALKDVEQPRLPHLRLH